MAVDDHGLEVLKKSAEQVVLDDKSDQYIKVGGLPSTSQGKIPPVQVQSGASTVTIFNHVTDGSANTENSLAIIGTVVYMLIRARSSGTKLQYSFTQTDSGTKFITINKHSVRCIENLKLTNPTLFIQADATSQVVEVEVGLS